MKSHKLQLPEKMQKMFDKHKNKFVDPDKFRFLLQTVSVFSDQPNFNRFALHNLMSGEVVIVEKGQIGYNSTGCQLINKSYEMNRPMMYDMNMQIFNNDKKAVLEILSGAI